MPQKQKTNPTLNLKTDIPSVEEYEFEPIKGYPMLHWKGKRPFYSTQFYPAQLKEQFGEEVDGWMNQIFWGDNLQVMSHLLKKYRGKVDLIYIDPPFDSKADYKKKIQLKGKQVTNDSTAFEEKQYTDIWSNDEYLQFMYERLILMRELLSDKGSIYVHCDYHKSHYLRLILDEIFGVARFKSEIIWKRTFNSGSSKALSNKFPSNTDSILWFSNGEEYLYNRQFKAYSIGALKRYDKVDSDGKRFKWNRMKTYSEEKLKRLMAKGEAMWTETSKYPVYKHYLDEDKGTIIDNLWDDVAQMGTFADERENYPTQKPEALLERIIKTSSNPGDLVFDCFMGSGTTQAVAMKLGRRFIGADINLGAIQTTTKRLLGVASDVSDVGKRHASSLRRIRQTDNPELPMGNAGDTRDTENSSDDGNPAVSVGNGHACSLRRPYTGFQIYNVNHYDVFRNPIEAKDILLRALEIQPLPGNNLYDGEKDGKKIKIMPINRIATRVDLNELITGFNYKEFEKSNAANPGKPVESIQLVCMGHEPDLGAYLKEQVKNSGFTLDVEVVDILRDKANLEFKRDSEAEITIENNKVLIRQFYPMNLLQKLSIMKENVENWKELVESVMIDFNYDGAVFEPQVVDVPEGDELVKGVYPVPASKGTIRVKITDLLSESLEVTL